MPNISNFMRRLCIILCALIGTLLPTALSATEPPRLVVNIVVGAMRSDDLARYNSNFTEQGFRRLMREGVTYTEAYYTFSTLSTASGLATLSTGANPSVHGVVGESWWSHTDAKRISLINDPKAYPVEFSTGSGNYSAHRITAPTVGDMLCMSNPQSKLFSLAIEPLGAIVLNGKHGTALWAEKNQTFWTTSSAYSDKLPEWITEYNKSNTNEKYVEKRWQPLYKASMYKNHEVAIVEGIKDKTTHLITDVDLDLTKTLYSTLQYTPAGNSAVLHFADEIIRREGLGQDRDTDILNIYLDSSRNIAQTYGTESIEYEDMLYRLDKDLIWFIDSLYTQVGAQEVVIVLTSDHGTSPSFNAAGSAPRHRFNYRQMEVIVNAYLGGRYGADNYVVGYANKSLYLNHATIAAKRLSYNDVCDEVATFLLQLQGVSNAVSASSMRNTTFSHGRTLLMQESFFGARSGDILIDFVAGCIIEDDDYRSLCTSGYNYDRHVPLIISRGTGENRTESQSVDLGAVAPTLCRLLGISQPWASSLQPLEL